MQHSKPERVFQLRTQVAMLELKRLLNEVSASDQVIVEDAFQRAFTQCQQIHSRNVDRWEKTILEHSDWVIPPAKKSRLTRLFEF